MANLTGIGDIQQTHSHFLELLCIFFFAKIGVHPTPSEKSDIRHCC